METNSMLPKEILGRRILFLRTLRGMTQSELAAKLKYKSSGTISLIEKGKFGMKKVKLLEAAKVLKVHPFVLQTPIDLSEDRLMLLAKFMEMLEDPDSAKNFDAIKTLIESQQ
jgi:transcriptional regulator with XRE-family HTH domain